DLIAHRDPLKISLDGLEKHINSACQIGQRSARIAELEQDYAVTLYMIMYARDPKARAEQQKAYVDTIRRPPRLRASLRAADVDLAVQVSGLAARMAKIQQALAAVIVDASPAQPAGHGQLPAPASQLARVGGSDEPGSGRAASAPVKPAGPKIAPEKIAIGIAAGKSTVERVPVSALKAAFDKGSARGAAAEGVVVAADENGVDEGMGDARLKEWWAATTTLAQQARLGAEQLIALADASAAVGSAFSGAMGSRDKDGDTSAKRRDYVTVSGGIAVMEQGVEGAIARAVSKEDHQAAKALVMFPPSGHVQECSAPRRVPDYPALCDDPEACSELKKLLAEAPAVEYDVRKHTPSLGGISGKLLAKFGADLGRVYSPVATKAGLRIEG
ncbi:unnamed protein product, partial [Prorocentrum cordatum]